MSKAEWLAWQKEVIREEARDEKQVKEFRNIDTDNSENAWF
ncbi:hypothetical protein [Bacillus sp. FSL K6-3431]